MSDLTITVRPSGGDYTSLATALVTHQASYPTLTTDNGSGGPGVLTFEIGGTWSSPDTNAVTIPNFTGDDTNYLRIITASPARHSGIWNTGKYMLTPANASALYIGAGNLKQIRIDGLQIGLTGTNGNYQAGIYGALAAADYSIRVSNCIIKMPGDATYINPGIIVEDSDYLINIWNTVVYGMGSVDHALNSCFCGYAGNWNIYNCVGIGGKYVFYMNAGSKTMTIKNSYGGGSATEDFYRGNGTLAKLYCASEDQSADDTSGADETASNCLSAAVLVDADTFVAVGSGSEDFHLAADGNSPLEGAGDAPGGSEPLNYTTDIDGDTCSDWCIGIDHPAADLAIAPGSISSQETHSNTAMMVGHIQSEV